MEGSKVLPLAGKDTVAKQQITSYEEDRVDGLGIASEYVAPPPPVPADRTPLRRC
mgnify:CR=1 FL=1